MKLKHLTFAFICLLVIIETAFASPAQVNFTGIVTGKDSTTSGLLGNIDKGDLIEGFFVYDSKSAIDINPWDVIGQYKFTSANSQFMMSIHDTSAGGNILYKETGFLSEIITENNWSYPGYPTIDSFTPCAILSNGWKVYLYLQNRNSNLDYINSDLLPDSTTLDISNYNYTKGTILSNNSLGQVYFDLKSASPLATPIPSSFFLFFTGFVSTGAALKKKRKHSNKKP